LEIAGETISLPINCICLSCHHASTPQFFSFALKHFFHVPVFWFWCSFLHLFPLLALSSLNAPVFTMKKFGERKIKAKGKPALVTGHVRL
jgi:hypothetical protein